MEYSIRDNVKDKIICFGANFMIKNHETVLFPSIIMQNDIEDAGIVYDRREIVDYNKCINYFNFLLLRAKSKEQEDYIAKYKLLLKETRVNHLVEKYSLWTTTTGSKDEK